MTQLNKETLGAFDPSIPSGADYTYSYEMGVDIYDDAKSQWQKIRQISDVDPARTPITQSAPTYSDKGAPNEVVTSESWTLSFFVQELHLPDGSVLPELELLRSAEEPTAMGAKANRQFRWYDEPAGGRKPDPDKAYSGIGTVSMTRAQTSADGNVAGYNVTITGKGRRTKIANPLTSAASNSV